MAMGCDVLSMNATNLPKVKWLLRQIKLSDAKALLDEVIELDNPHLVLSTLHLALRRMGLGKVLSQAR